MVLATLSIFVIADPSDVFDDRLNETVTDGNCPWWLIERASVVCEAWVKALSGIALDPTEGTMALAPLMVPASTVAGEFRAPEAGVYLTEAVSALEPAAAEAEEEKELT